MNLLIVFAFAGDSTMTRFLAIAAPQTGGRIVKIPRARVACVRGGTISEGARGRQNCYAAESAQAHRALPLVEGAGADRRGARRDAAAPSRRRTADRGMGDA